MAGSFVSEAKQDERRLTSSDETEESLVQRVQCLDQRTTSAVLPVAAYCLASILMTVINKFIVSGTGFSMNLLLLCIQSSVCVLCVLTAKSCGLMSVRDFDINDAKRWFPISLSIVAVVYTGSKSLQFFNIAVYSIFKNFTLILIAYGEKFTTGAQVPRLALVSFLLMILSSVIAATSDTRLPPAQVAFGHSFNVGYVWMLLNCIATAANSLMMRARMKSTGFKDGDTTFYNNLLAIPVLISASLIIEDWSPANLARNFPEDTRNVLIFAVLVSGAALAFISYTIAWCLRATSSTTCSMAGALNKLPVAASGMIFFGDPVTVGSVSAIGTGFVAGLLYIEAKRRAPSPPPESAEDDRQPVLPLHHEKQIQ